MPRLGIVVPYRDRQEHLDIFIPYMRNFFRTDKLNSDIDYRILDCRTNSGLPFNRGAIKNIGFMYLAPQLDYVCFHDVDLIPIAADYRQSSNPAMIAYHGLGFKPEFVKQLFGGVVVLNKDHFEQANGFSNDYWGWGFEDVDMRERLLRCNLRPEHRQGHFKKLPHVDEGSHPGGAPTQDHIKNKALYVKQWFQQIGGSFRRIQNFSGSWKTEGLNSVNFTEIEARRSILPARKRIWSLNTLLSHYFTAPQIHLRNDNRTNAFFSDTTRSAVRPFFPRSIFSGAPNEFVPTLFHARSTARLWSEVQCRQLNPQ